MFKFFCSQRPQCCAEIFAHLEAPPPLVLPTPVPIFTPTWKSKCRFEPGFSSAPVRYPILFPYDCISWEPFCSPLTCLFFASLSLTGRVIHAVAFVEPSVFPTPFFTRRHRDPLRPQGFTYPAVGISSKGTLAVSFVWALCASCNNSPWTDAA